MTNDQGFEERLLCRIRELVGPNAQMFLLRSGSSVADSTAIYEVRDPQTHAVLQVSPPAYPDVAAEGAARASVFALRLGKPLAEPVLLAMADGRVDGRSFALLPYHHGFSGWRPLRRVQRAMITPRILDWIAALPTRGEAAQSRGAPLYRRNLRALAESEVLAPNIRVAAAEALARFEQGEIAPYLMPMHGDFWTGNILRSEKGAYPFTVIDWGGSRVEGFPIYDLVRIASSHRLRRGKLRAELQRHARLIGCTLDDTLVYLLAALGHFAANSDEVAPDLFPRLAKETFDDYRRACSAG